jgi:hypothetical protein
MMSAAVLAVVLAPILIRWACTLANRRSDVRDKFRPSPPLRAVYPGGLIMFGWCFAFEASNVWNSGSRPNIGDILGLMLAAGGLAMTILSWPIVVEVFNEGLTWQRLLVKRNVTWREVEDVNTDMSGGLVIYLSGDRRINVGQYTEGRPELKAFITEHALGRIVSS